MDNLLLPGLGVQTRCKRRQRGRGRFKACYNLQVSKLMRRAMKDTSSLVLSLMTFQKASSILKNETG